MKASLLKAINNVNSLDEINEVVELVHLKQKQLRAEAAKNVKNSVSKGTRVIISQSTGNLIGEVIKVNRTKAVVKIDEYKGRSFVNCTVPLSMLKTA